jgi:alcohol dehydrogenase, propanol-preferring
MFCDVPPRVIIRADAALEQGRRRTSVRAWRVVAPGENPSTAMKRVEETVPEPGPGEILVAVDACGVCRTDLHVAAGDLPVHARSVVPGHEVVGRVVDVGEGVTDRQPGDRVGVAWLRETCGRCDYCRRGAENLCPRSRYSGWDADGGYADFTTVRSDFAYELPAGYTDAELAPLLCAGIIGFRALRRTHLPPGGRLGIYGFGASAHLTAQVAMAEGARVHVLTRAAEAQELALELGAASAGGAYDPPPEPLDAAILFAPVGDLVPVALEALDRGGTLAVAGIHLSDIPVLNYQRHLFQERTLRSVTSNTRVDGRALLEFAATHRIHVSATPYPLDQADRALADLAADRVTGAAVLLP